MSCYKCTFNLIANKTWRSGQEESHIGTPDSIHVLVLEIQNGSYQLLSYGKLCLLGKMILAL